MAIVPVLYLCVPKAASTEPVWVAIATTYATKTLAKAFDARLQPSIVQVKDLKPLVCASSSTWLVPASQDLHRLKTSERRIFAGESKAKILHPSVGVCIPHLIWPQEFEQELFVRLKRSSVADVIVNTRAWHGVHPVRLLLPPAGLRPIDWEPLAVSHFYPMMRANGQACAVMREE